MTREILSTSVRINLRRFYSRLVALSMFFAAFPVIAVPGIFFTLSDGLLAAALLGFIMSCGMRLPSTLSRVTVIGWIIGSGGIGLGFLVTDLLRADVTLRTGIVIVQYLFAYIAVLVAFLCLRSSSTVIKVFNWFMSGVLITGIGTLLLYVLNRNGYNQLVDVGIFTMKTRISGVFNPNEIAKIIATMMPFVMWQYLRSDSLKYLAAILGLLAIVAGTASIGGMAAIIIGITIFVFCVIRERKNRLRLGVIGILGASAAYGLMSTPMGEPMIQLVERRVVTPLLRGSIESAGSFTEKMDLNSEALAYIAASPLIGIGTNQFAQMSHSGLQVHNTYLLVWAEGGLISIVGVVLAIGSLIVPMLVLSREGMRLRRVRRDFGLLAATVVVFTVNLMTNTNTYDRPSLIPLLLTLVLVLRLYEERNLPQSV